MVDPSSQRREASTLPVEPTADDDTSSAAAAIPAEEERWYGRIRDSLMAHGAGPANVGTRAPATSEGTPSRGAVAASSAAASRRARRFDEELVALRDEIGEARLEDVPALVAQMERLQEVSLTRAALQTVLVDADSPYFGHLRLRERVPGRGLVERDVFIGRATYTDPRSRLHIVDWRNAPVSQLYYRYSEGSDYEETFGEREIEGEVTVRRTVTIEGATLLRVASPQGVWVKRAGPAPATSSPGPVRWQRTDVPIRELTGGEEKATRPVRPRGLLGAAPDGPQRLDRHLPEIAALIDPRQFEIMTAKESGVIVIEGGAGSGKTTIGLHRLAYLAFAFPAEFPARRMLAVTHGSALANYMGQVLPALGLAGVRVMTFRDWAERELRAAVPWIRATVTEEVALAVTRVKSHPALLHELERRAAARHGKWSGGKNGDGEADADRGARERGGKKTSRPVGHRKRGSRAVVELWADLLTDLPLLLRLVKDTPEMPVSEADVVEAHRIMVTRVNAIVTRDPRDRPHDAKLGDKRSTAAARAKARAAQAEALAADNASSSSLAWFGVSASPGGKSVDSDLPEGVRRFESEREDFDDDENIRGEIGIDGMRTEDDQPILDVDDLAILLRAHQLIRRAESPSFAHLFVDEAQDLSPMKLAVLIGFTATTTTSSTAAAGLRASITLAGDPAQKLFLDNGFGDWRAVLGHLGMSHVAIEPLRIAYRSTREILELAQFAMGPLAASAPPAANRVGAPVEAFRFVAIGAAVAFLAEALRELSAREPRATVALIARHPEQADRYFEGLRRAEVPGLRRVRAQEFTFRPGVEVTDVRQVKGLEFDYVVLLDANASSYGTDDESRHLFHIGVTRAAHQLWLVVTGAPSPLLPREILRD